MRKLTTSRAVNRELTARIQMTPAKSRVKRSPENIVFATLGALVIIAVLVNVLVYGIPNL